MSAQPAHSRQKAFARPSLRPQDRLDNALDRLRHAADTLEASLLRRDRESKSVAALEQQLEAVTQDRAKLAHELDQVRAKASRLDAASSEVAGRLDAVMSGLHSVLARG